MNTNNNNARNGGIGFFGLLTVAFIILKLCKVINWSWIWVLAPAWIPVCFWIGVIIVILIINSRRI